jgi:hypothetical protein
VSDFGLCKSISQFIFYATEKTAGSIKWNGRNGMLFMFLMSYLHFTPAGLEFETGSMIKNNQDDEHEPE